MGLGMGRGTRRFYEGDGECEGKACEKKYTKKQISEAIKYWQKQLKKMDEDISFDRKYTGPSASGPSAEENPDTVVLNGYERIKDRTSDVIVNKDIADFFRALAKKCNSDWI